MTRLSADERRVLVGRLLDQRRTAGLPAEEVSRAAKQVGIAERTLWRWLAGGLPGMSPRSRYHLTEADRDAYAAARGNVAAAWRAQQQANDPVPSLRTFQMAIARELLPIERAATVDGIEGQRRHTVYLRWEARHRNARWEADHVELPVLVLPPRATRPCRPWATLFIDTYSRLLVGWALALSPSTATVLAALRMGLVIDPERRPFGGIPMELRLDRGLEFAAEALTSVAATLGIRMMRAPAYTPHLKGKIERLNRTVAQDFLSTLPFYTDGPRDAAGRLYELGIPPLTFERFAAEFQDWVEHYNTARPHAGLAGETPLERWKADPTPVHKIPPADLRFLLLAGAERRITKHGIRFGGLHFIAPELNGRVGQTVEVRWMPHDLRTIEVFYMGQWLCVARPQGVLTAEERDQVLRRRRLDAAELARRQRRTSRQARVRLAPITEAGPIEEVTVVTRDQARQAGYHRDDEHLWRLTRVDLLGLQAQTT
jgi:putative transposase